MDVSFMWKGAEILAEMHAVTDKGAELAAEHLLAVSRTLVPYKTGALSRSGETRKTGEGQYEVTYTAAYALEMHENLMIHHPGGRIAKYLEKPALSEARTMFGIMSADMKF
jgi:hypothetical protein